MIVYYDWKEGAFLHCDSFEDSQDSYIPLESLKDELILRYRRIIPPKQLEVTEENKKEEEKGKRSKERNIGEVVKKVTEWKKLYTHGINGSKSHTLKEAANIVKVPRKTLSDYLLLLKKGKKYGFDFNMYSEAKIGLLRLFVKLKLANEKAVAK
eukprot:TRINITY_DN6932_c0_g4_i3.p1 TRINITY_DN6932_c0_g4~~TRINITY_DN6932_c0_g4_i3.p1  ORF type:complete len:154 (+),score=30.29 TRINITY_DN6932_c0_g4_i3:321-782(+)